MYVVDSVDNHPLTVAPDKELFFSTKIYLLFLEKKICPAHEKCRYAICRQQISRLERASVRSDLSISVHWGMRIFLFLEDFLFFCRNFLKWKWLELLQFVKIWCLLNRGRGVSSFCMVFLFFFFLFFVWFSFLFFFFFFFFLLKSSSHPCDIDMYYNIHRFFKRATKTQISLHIYAGWSGPALPANCIKALFLHCASYVVVLLWNTSIRDLWVLPKFISSRKKKKKKKLGTLSYLELWARTVKPLAGLNSTVCGRSDYRVVSSNPS